MGASACTGGEDWAFGVPAVDSPAIMSGESLKRLIECGITLAEGVTADDVGARMDEFVDLFGDEPSEFGRWLGLLTALGEGRATNVVSIDPECDANYPAFVGELNRLAGAELVRVISWSGLVEDDDAPITVSVELPDTARATWRFKNEADWIDVAVVSKFADVVASHSDRRMFQVEVGDDDWSDEWVANLMAQNMLIVCCAQSVHAALGAATSLSFVPLS